VAVPQIRAYLDAHLVQGNLDVKERRVSDFICDPNISLLVLDHATWQDMLAAADNTPAPADSARVRKDLARLIVPGDSPSVLAPRVATQQVAVHIGVGLFTVDGMLNRRVGETTPIDQMLRGAGRLFVPITNAIVRYGPNGSFDTEIPVALVNTGLVQYWTGPRG
jgi:hypothetical protein